MAGEAGGVNDGATVIELNGVPDAVLASVPAGIETLTMLSEERRVTGAVVTPAELIAPLKETEPVPVTGPTTPPPPPDGAESVKDGMVSLVKALVVSPAVA